MCNVGKPPEGAEPSILSPIHPSMTAYRYLQLDVFAHQPGTGNPLGVVFDADGLSTDRMQALAAWLNLSETVFFLRPTAAGADYHVRIFTPASELPFAGHPSVGVNSALLRKLRSTLTGFSLMARLRSRRVPAFMRDKVSWVPNGCNVMQEQREKVMQETGICV